MPTMTISLNDALKEHVSSKGLSAGAYIRMLILQDMLTPLPEDKRKKLEMASMYLGRNGLEKTKELFSELFENVELPADNRIEYTKPAIIQEPRATLPTEVRQSIKKKKERPVIPPIQ